MVELIGLIAERASEDIEPKEWIRICIDLLDLLKGIQEEQEGAK